MLRNIAHVGEGQDRDRWPVRQWQRCCAEPSRGGHIDDLAKKAVAAPRNRLQAIRANCFPRQDFAQSGNLRLKIILFDHPARPDLSHEVVLCSELAPPPDERQQQVKCPRPDRDTSAAKSELPSTGEEVKRTETERIG